MRRGRLPLSVPGALLLWYGLSVWGPPASAGSTRWLRDAGGHAEAMRQQSAAGADVLVYFYADWCGFCKSLDQRLLSSSEVEELLARTVAVRVNPEHGAQEAQLGRQYGIRGYPSVFIVPAQSGRPREIRVSARMSPADFVRACEEAAGPRDRRTSSVPRQAQPPAPPAGRAASPPAARRTRTPTTRHAAARASPAKGPRASVQLRNGAVLAGELARQDAASVTLRWEFGQMTIERDDIQRLVIDPAGDGSQGP